MGWQNDWQKKRDLLEYMVHVRGWERSHAEVELGIGKKNTGACPECGHPSRDGYCYYCGWGKRPVKSAEERAADEARALEIWAKTEPIAGTLVERYLRDHRKIDILPPSVDDVLRFHPRCPFDYDKFIPCMVALLRDVVTDRPCGVHRTPLDGAGRKTEKARVMGTFGRAAVKLWPAPVEGLLTIGEGIETTLSFVELYPDLAPAWAVGTANNIATFPIITLKELRIAVDNDPKERGQVGQRKAKQLGGRYSAFAIQVRYFKPSLHEDFNDVLRGRK